MTDNKTGTVSVVEINVQKHCEVTYKKGQVIQCHVEGTSGYTSHMFKGA